MGLIQLILVLAANYTISAYGSLQFYGANLVVVFLFIYFREYDSEKKRAIMDQKQNSIPCTKIVIDESQPSGVHWKEIKLTTDQVRVGDVLRIKDDEIIAADCVILTSNSKIMDPKTMKLKQGQTEVGMVQCSTTLLDGKLDLKPKYAVNEVDKAFKIPERDHIKQMTKLRGLKISADPPTKDPEVFNAKISLLGGNVHENLNIHNFLPKGSKIVDSTQVEAIVIYTGEHTKLQINQFVHSWKWS